MNFLTQAKTVEFEAIVRAIEQFNQAGQNPFGPNVPGIDIEFEFYPMDRTAGTQEFLKQNPSFRTRHPVLYPMTRALIQRQWHRVYAYNVEQAKVEAVKLLVSRKQDPDLFKQHPKASAYPWIFAVKESSEPIVLDA
jgi:hypothetical protein